MIYKIKGAVMEKQPGFAVIDVNGVAYEATVSLFTYASMPPVGEAAELYTYMSVREDGVSLFGFSSLEEKSVFLQLVTVSGIGPKLAVKILGGIGADALKKAVACGDHDLLSSVPGVGKKTAQRMVVELKDRFDDLSNTDFAPDDARRDVESALQNLGYKAAECRKAVENLSSSGDFEDLLRQALKAISGKS